MGIFDAMITSVVGLQAQAYALTNISGNIANSQTTGFKRVDTSFQDLVSGASTASYRQNAGSVLALSRATNTMQGSVSTSSTATHLAISGDGYFQVQTKIGESDGKTLLGDAKYYTRRGDFEVDREGYLVNGAGYYLMGRTIDTTTGNPVGDATTPIQLPTGLLAAKASTRVDYNANLPANSSVGLIDASTWGDTTLATVQAADDSEFQAASLNGGQITCYDAKGSAVNVQMRWAKTATSPDTWNLFYKSDSTATGTTAMWTNAGSDFTFDSSGKLTSPTDHLDIAGLTVDGNDIGDIRLAYGDDGLTEYSTAGATVTVNSIAQDGYASGSLTGVSVDTSGRLTATYSNGQQVDVAELTLFSFAGDAGLRRMDGGAFAVSRESGPALESSGATITGQALEASNVDIADEFSKMIITQQAYSANSKVISTADNMMQDILAIVR
ncbi:MAG: flagellar hook protein FlgE [Siculibacillus sp.]|nr:flagellar hook protein FlgE [Siculibacillus sp.]